MQTFIIKDVLSEEMNIHSSERSLKLSSAKINHAIYTTSKKASAFGEKNTGNFRPP